MSRVLTRGPLEPKTETVDADEPSVIPLKFIVHEDADPEHAIEIVEAEMEQAYSVDDAYERSLFVAICRRRGLRVYRRPRQRANTLCVRATVSAHDSIWRTFRLRAEGLRSRLAEVTTHYVEDDIDDPA